MNVVFRPASTKRLLGRPVAFHGAPGSCTHAGQFVTGLLAPRIMENVERRSRVDAFDFERMRFIANVANKDAFVASLRQVPGDVVYRVHDSNIKMIGPVTLRVGRWRVPVILLLIIDKNGHFAWRMNQVAKGCRRQRQPTHEVRIGFERIVGVIQKHELWRTGKYDGVASARYLKRMVVPRLDRLDMRRVKLAQLCTVAAHGLAS